MLTGSEWDPLTRVLTNLQQAADMAVHNADIAVLNADSDRLFCGGHDQSTRPNL